jgi:long-chain-fatty-acid--[acyl-carrier-protein] ligase
LLANLLFFTPRRDVTVTVEMIHRDDLPGINRERLNPFLEAWYNRDGAETPTYVPYHRLVGPREFDFPDFERLGAVDIDRIKPATINAVNEMLEESLGRPLDEEERKADFDLGRLGLDSIQRMEVALAIEDRFGFRSDEVPETLGQLWALADGQLSATAEKIDAAPPGWDRPASGSQRVEILAETIAEAFVRRALLHPDDVALADELSGVLRYRRLLVGAKLLSKQLRDLPGHAVGVMLPASVAADVVFFALHLSGKLPVMLNWTTGPANLAHAVKALDIRHVVTSQRMIDRLGIHVQGADYAYLENLRAKIGKPAQLFTMLLSYAAPKLFLRGIPRQQPDDTAVVLFTSGSESAPKAVPLTHRNLISNAWAAIDALDVTRSEVILGFLPPFHSFGLTGNIIAPILGGLRVVHYPDPTNATALVQTTARYRATLLIATPTFLGYMLDVARPEELQSLRILVTGAEKCPEAVFEKAARLASRATIIEGYGITECSPVVAANRPGRVKLGTIGLPVKDVKIRLVDPETKDPLTNQRMGMLVVRGPGVFSGYLNHSGPDPFVELDGKRWYVTGDLVEVDDEGFIHFRGRLKRFLKAGGEMISLPALEEPLARLYPPTEDGPQVAVEGIETPDGRRIVLFTTQDLSVRQANAILSEAGFRGIMRIDEVVQLDQIPVLGTGKTDYKVLRQRIAQPV